ncbi:MAG: TauD/TfdA family dioxygenase [Myxococcota bacterium]|nr:TauD/TfdA family dioxygenase [Myxococcota bacterium]
MTLSIEPTGATLGARVGGVDLARLDADALEVALEADWEAILDAFHEHALLIFGSQSLDTKAQVAFGRRFGEIEHLYGRSGAIPITNQGPDGKLLPDSTLPMQIMRGNEGWHTDSSYMPLSAKASILSAQVVPASGGGTEWADMRAAYDALAPEMRERIADLCAFHSIRRSQAKIGHQDGEGSYGFDVDPPPLRPLVKRHPVTGRPALYIGRHAYGIPGLSEAESEALLDELLDFACRPPRVYEHRWEPGDVVVWDNRCLLHRARPYDHTELRRMRHTRIAGDPRTESALEAAPC